MTERDIRSPEERIAALEEELHTIESRLWCPDCQVPRGAMLSDRDLIRLVNTGRIKIEPLPNIELGPESDLGTCKVDLHLGDSAKFLDAAQVSHLDLRQPVPDGFYKDVDIKTRGEVIVHPGKVVVAITRERITLPDDIMGRMEGRSSLARIGISVQAAPAFDAGWDGGAMLELHNIGEVPVILPHSYAVCAISFTHLSSSTLQPYSLRASARYRNQTDARI